MRISTPQMIILSVMHHAVDTYVSECSMCEPVGAGCGAGGSGLLSLGLQRAPFLAGHCHLEASGPQGSCPLQPETGSPRGGLLVFWKPLRTSTLQIPSRSLRQGTCGAVFLRAWSWNLHHSQLVGDLKMKIQDPTQPA